MSDAHDWQELIDRHLRGELSESEQERLAELLDSDAAARKDFVEQVQWDTRLAEVLRDSHVSLREPDGDAGAAPEHEYAPMPSHAFVEFFERFTLCGNHAADSSGSVWLSDAIRVMNSRALCANRGPWDAAM